MAPRHAETECIGSGLTNRRAATSTGVGRKKKDRTLTRQKVSEIADPETLLLVIVRDRVYDCTRWQKNHPGGHLALRALCGTDATDPFLAYHPDVVEKKLLANFFYARIEDPVEPDSTTKAFRQLTDELRAGGAFETDYSVYYVKSAVYMAMLVAIVAGVTLSGSIWIHAASGALLGLFWQQVAFLGHDLGHNSVTHDRTMDSVIGLFAGNLLTGISIGWWKLSHNVHHIVPNSCEHDPNIQHLPLFAISKLFLTNTIFSKFHNRPLPVTKATHLLVRQQHWLYFPVMAVARFNLYIQSIKHALGVGPFAVQEKVWQRELQIMTLVGFWVWLTQLILLLPTWQSRLVFLMLSHNVAGILHVQITLSHFCMPAYTGSTMYDHNDQDTRNSFLRSQLETSMDIDCSTWMDWFHGGLQYQVVHHVWPRLARHKLRKVLPKLIRFCNEHSLPYHRYTFYDANCRMLSQLKEIGATTKTFSELFGDSINLRG